MNTIELKERTELLKSQLHTLLDTFYDETSYCPVVEITTEVFDNKETLFLASDVQVYLK